MILILILIINLLLAQPQDDIIIKDSWMRPNGKGMTTALYFSIENTGDQADTLFKIESELSKKVEIHETYQKDDMMGMREVGQIIIPAGSIFELKPGSYHIMLIGLNRDVEKDYEGEFSLFFKQAGEIKINARAKAMQNQMKEHHH
jgi:periplasmic copper chaperone A